MFPLAEFGCRVDKKTVQTYKDKAIKCKNLIELFNIDINYKKTKGH
jgi:hypothetical protein